MVPGVSESDCRVAEFRYRQMLHEGQHQQFAAGACPGSTAACSVSPSLRRQFGVLLVRAGERLQGVQTVMRESHNPTLTGQMGASA